MPTSWNELIEVGADAQESAAAEPPPEAEARRGGLFQRLRESLATSREALSAEISSSLFETLDTETWERLEEALIMADVGAATTAQVVGRLEAEVEEGKVDDGESARARLIELIKQGRDRARSP